MVLGLIALGGAVRATNSGLACPDWPLCFGKFIPDFHPQVYFEFIHRVLAGTIGILTASLAALIYKRKEYASKLKVFMSVALFFLAGQIILGGLTVRKLLHFGTVTGHLALGIAFYGSLLWIAFHLREDKASLAKSRFQLPSAVRAMFALSAILVYGQIILGGLVSSNYAGMACGGDWPLCLGDLIPTFEGAVGLHVMHRFGAYMVVIVLFSVNRVLRLSRDQEWMTPEISKLARILLSLALFQIALGIANIKFQIPPLITVAHLLVAALIFGLLLRLCYLSNGRENLVGV